MQGDPEPIDTAVIVADSFDRRYSPITLEIPRALMPICNVPMIDYTIEFLASSGIRTFYIFCCSHAKMIEDYLEQSRWSKEPDLEVITLIATNAEGVGDALREVHRDGHISSHFVLVTGDVLSNVNLRPILESHTRRAQKDRGTLMTVVFKKATPTHSTRSLEDDTVVAMDADTEQLLHFDNTPGTNVVEIDPSTVRLHGNLRVRYDLIDCHIDVCSPAVLDLFNENFDYQDIRRHFLNGVLTAEIYGNKVFGYITSGEYAARVKDLRTYVSVSKDIIHRWMYPITVDANMLQDESSYQYSRLNVYKEAGVLLSRNTFIESDTVIGAGTSVGAHTHIASSVIGRGCRIGNNVRIENSYVWGNVHIADGCTISSSIICDQVRLLKGSTVSEGCVISFGVVIGPDAVIPRLTKLTCVNPLAEDFDLQEDEATTEPANDILGAEGKGLRWVVAEETSHNSLLGRGYKGSDAARSGKAIGSGAGGEDDEDDDDPIAALVGLAEPDPVDVLAPGVAFDSEVREIVREHILEDACPDPENIVMEVNSRKFAHDKTFLDCALSIVRAFLDAVPSDLPSAREVLTSFMKIVQQWHVVLMKFITNPSDRCEVIWGLQQCVEEEEYARFDPIFHMLLHTLYNCDVLDEESVFKWERETLQGTDHKFVRRCAKFLTWLREAESESESTEESSD